MATVHHRRVVVGPTPTWYQERQGSHNRNYATCAARNTPYSLTVYSAAASPRAESLCLGDSAISFPARFAKPRVDYSVVSHPQTKINCCWPAELIATPPVKRSGIPTLSCWSQPAWDWERFLLREAPHKLYASHEQQVPTMKNCQPLPREQKQHPLFPLESRFYCFADSLYVRS